MKVRNKILSIVAGTLIGMSVSGAAQAAGWTDFNFVGQIRVGVGSVRIQLENYQNVSGCANGTWYVLPPSDKDGTKEVLAMALLAKSTDQQIRIYSASCIFGYNRIKYVQMK